VRDIQAMWESRGHESIVSFTGTFRSTLVPESSESIWGTILEELWMILILHIASGEFFDIDNLESPVNDGLPQGSQSLL